jgi:hypothetical protein
MRIFAGEMRPPGKSNHGTFSAYALDQELQGIRP